MAKGGRGGKGGGGAKLTAKQERQIEDNTQLNEAKFYGYRYRKKYYEYTDSEGKLHKGETGQNTGGTYRTQYSEKVAGYAKMSTQELENLQKKFQAQSDENYQKGAWAAASRVGRYLKAMVEADAELAAIKKVLRRRK